MCHFILLCEKLKELQNYNGLMTIYTGLVQFPIQRLKNSWKSLNFIYLNKWRAIEELMSPYRNFKELRELELKTNPPKVPCLTLLFHDLILSEDGNEDYCDPDKKYLNLHKTLVLGKIYCSLLETRKEHYPLSRVDIYDLYIKGLKDSVLTNDQINELSFEVEGFD